MIGSVASDFCPIVDIQKKKNEDDERESSHIRHGLLRSWSNTQMKICVSIADSSMPVAVDLARE